MSHEKILVTGASGFLGSHLCAALADRGIPVRALYRRKAAPPELSRLESRGVELMNGDLGDPETCARAVRGVGAVIHSAALAMDWGDPKLFRSINVEATARLLDAAQRASCGTFLYISSAVVHGFGPHVDTTEEGPYHPLAYPYQTTKLEAEKLVLARNAPGFGTLAVRPCNVYGPGDHTSTYAMFAAILGSGFGYLGDGSAYTCPIYIDDLCAGVIAALESPRAAGEAILLTDGQKVPWKRYVEVMYEAVGSGKKPLSLPLWVAFPAARAMSFAWHLAGSKSPPPLTMYRVEQGARHYHFSNEKAKRLLGFSPTVFIEEGLARTARAFLDERGRR